ncbi:hypothetical protein V6N11_061058 [Hibiscus sabdariffa]|uniref:Uncharacterized protein n=2 Tax=Hibiscus sabdariffa TaxID=183260 RepID=A0ABR2QS90_9ROSI
MELVILVSCSFLIALMKFLYDYLWRPLRIQHMLNSQGIKGPPYRFIHGNNKEIVKMEKEALSKPLDLTHDIFPKVRPHLSSWINIYGKNYLYWNGVRAQLVISEPELVKEVLKNSEKAIPKKKPSIFASKLVGNGLVSLEGEKWARQRKLANYVFHGENLKNMTPAVIASVETMLEKWKGREGRDGSVPRVQIIDIRSDIQNSFCKLWKSADLLESEELAKEIQDCVVKIVKKRENKVVIGEADSFGNDFLGLLVHAYHDSDEKNRLSLEDLVDECKTFYLAG